MLKIAENHLQRKPTTSNEIDIQQVSHGVGRHLEDWLHW